MRREDILRVLKKAILRNHIKKAYLFGSFIHNKKYNDIDIAIEPPKEFSLLDLARMANELEEKIGVRVDLITLKSIHPRLKNVILKEMVAV